MRPALRRVILGTSPNVWKDAAVTVTGEAQRLGVQSYRILSTGALCTVAVTGVLKIGRTYEVTFNVDIVTTAGAGIRVGDTGDIYTTVGPKSSLYVATSPNAFIKRSVNAVDYTISNVSFRLR